MIADRRAMRALRSEYRWYSRGVLVCLVGAAAAGTVLYRRVAGEGAAGEALGVSHRAARGRGAGRKGRGRARPHRDTRARRKLTPATAARSNPTTQNPGARHLLENYPNEPFGEERLDDGAVALYIFGMLYTFLALALVCDSFFVPALEVIVEKIDMSYDVAGATFMAAGGSAPELFTSFIGTFVSESDVGVGTIVGSAVFNVLFVIGMVAITSRNTPQRERRKASMQGHEKAHENKDDGTPLKLTWWPLARDSVFYAIFLGLLAFFFWDQNIKWWEAAVLFFLYFVYCGAMVFNEELGEVVRGLLSLERNPAIPTDEDRQKLGEMGDAFSGGVLDVMFKYANKPKKRFRAGVRKVITNRGKLKMAAAAMAASDAAAAGSGASEPSGDGGDGSGGEASPDANSSSATDLETVELAENGSAAAADDGQTEEDRTAPPANLESFEPFTLPERWRARALWAFLWPIAGPVYLTTPDVTKPRWRNWYPLSFIMSILWIGVHSYLMVWWATVVGDVFGIPDAVMGVSVLAAGTSVPDLITSVLVAQRGYGDMAVSSSIGSNIFDVAVGLPLPWLMYCIINNESLDVGSDGLVVSVCILLGMSVVVILSIYAFAWKLTKGLGYFMVSLYFVFLTASILLEVL